MINEEKIRGIHTQDNSLFLKNIVIAIGWKDMGDLSLIEKNKDAFKEKYTHTYSGRKKVIYPPAPGTLYRFCYEVQIGDYVVLTSKICNQ